MIRVVKYKTGFTITDGIASIFLTKDNLEPDDIACLEHMSQESKPKRKRKRSNTRRSGAPNRKVNYAQNVIGKAMTDLVDRVNGKDYEDE